MIKARHTWFFVNFFRLYINWIIKRNFSKIICDLPEIDPTKPLLVVGNHHSWWDGFLAIYLNNRYWGKRFFVMMMLEQLKKYQFFRKIGAFSVDQGNRSVIESMNYAVKVLKSRENMLLMYPQGRIESQHHDIITFRKGVARLIEQTENVNVLMLISLTDHLSHKKSGLWVYGKIYENEKGIELSFNDFYQQTKKLQQQCIG